MKKNIKHNNFLIDNIARDVEVGKDTILLKNRSREFLPYLVHDLSKDLSKKIVILSADEIFLKNLDKQLNELLNNGSLLLEGEEIKFYKIEAKDKDEERRRITTLSRIAKGDFCCLLLNAGSITKKYEPKSNYVENTITLGKGQIIRTDELLERLSNIGYERTSRLENFGQFSQRGEIFDIFPANLKSPIRIVFFDDEIESIKLIDIASQMSIRDLDEIEIIQAREFIYDKIEEKSLSKLNSQTEKSTKEDIIEEIISIENGWYFSGLSKYVDFIYEGGGKSIFSYLEEKDTIVLIDDPQRFNEKIENNSYNYFTEFENSYKEGYALKIWGKSLFEKKDLSNQIKSFQKLYLTPFDDKDNAIDSKSEYSLDVEAIGSFKGNISRLVNEVNSYLSRDNTVIICETDTNIIKNYIHVFAKSNLVPKIINEFDEIDNESNFFILNLPFKKGFYLKNDNLVIIGHSDIFVKGQSKKSFKKGRIKTSAIKSFLDILKGDYVVHETYGIGKFLAVEKKEHKGTVKDYIKIEYSKGDLIFVPISQMDKVQRYVGNSKSLTLTNLGSSQWKKQKSRAKKAIDEIAKYLVELYAIRENNKGYKFSEDTVWQNEFEEQFPYDETEDQLNAIEEIKSDMESDKPMDRLLCGDVGYGKTEVAVRAIFKAAMDTKQSAFLVPTTILAQQHYDTIKERFENFPVNVEVISRFKTKKEQVEILKKVESGNVDLLIGTHRILSKDVKFKDLGFLVVDEEQRFGVKDKEKIKNLRKNVDVLTLTATPIPRTLDMALSGIRDISLLEKPPSDRLPVVTYITAAKESIIKDAVEKEVARGGQVFFVYNRVESINYIKKMLQDLMPDIRIAVAHGQMTPTSLENIIFDYLNKEYDLLLCTTIIETGIDIPNANTIIVYDADKMGLSQLYQLRGRVGRSSRQAYSYFMYEKNKNISEIAQARLKTIAEFTEFGSGYKVAMRDLEIRGAGNVLGERQHGHIQEIGYDLYIKMLKMAIKNLQGEESVEEKNCEVYLDVDAFVPDEYIEDEVVRMEIYKKISAISSKDEYEYVKNEIEDRFSKLPNSVENLLKISYIKSLGEKLSIEKISQKVNFIKYESNVDILRQNFRNRDLGNIPEIVIDFLEKAK